MVNIGVAGLGTVGAAVVRLLRNNAQLIMARAGQPVSVTAVSARDRAKQRPCDLSAIQWVDNPLDLVNRDEIDIVVELIGGAEGIAPQLAEATLNAKKNYVTANKALIAARGAPLAALAERFNGALAFEASVAGGIPVIKALREGLAANHIMLVRGILNGTCNYILTRMEEAQLTFGDALKEAQQKGYAEADASSDIDGHDAANKLAILAALAFGAEPNLRAVRVDGIRRLLPIDLVSADELGCRIKLLGVGRIVNGLIDQRVGAFLVPKTSPLAAVSGVKNAVMLRGDFVGDISLEGPGAGAEATASAVVADIVDIVRGSRRPAFGIPTASLRQAATVLSPQPARHYVRMQVLDKPGVVADISAILRDEAISIESLLQRGKSTTESVPVVITTHDAGADAMARAVKKLSGLPTVVGEPCVMPIED